MKEFRTSKNDTAHYSSFEEVAKVFGCKPILKRTTDQEKLNKQRNDFCSKHICRACKQPMTYNASSNIMVCTNQNCKGIKYETKNEETGEIKIKYNTSFRLLDEKSSEIANNLFN